MHQDDRRAGGFGCIVNRVDLDALGRALAAPSLQLRDASLQPPSLHHPSTCCQASSTYSIAKFELSELSHSISKPHAGENSFCKHFEASKIFALSQ